MTDMLLYDMESYTRAAYTVWVTRICQLCPCIIFFYDYFLTLDREVEYIWKRPVTSSNILYMIVRFGGGVLVVLTAAAFVGEHTSKKFCAFFLTFQGWPSFCILWAVQLILQLRVYALYRQSRKILIAMVVGFTAEVFAMSALLGIGMAETQNTNQPLPGITICAVSRAPTTLAYIWLPDIIFGTFLFVLAARIGFKRRRLGFNIFNMGRQDLVGALVHGNAQYFFCILAVNAVNAGIWQWLGYQWFEAPEGFAAVIEIILGCRMVLDLRSAVSRHEGLHLSDSFPLRPSFGAREGRSALCSVASTCDQHQLIEQIELVSPRSTSGESSHLSWKENK